MAAAATARMIGLRAEIALKVGGDDSFGSAHQPIRVPGTIHGKYGRQTPVRIVSHQDIEVELRDAGLEPSRTPWSEWGLRLPSEPPPNIQALEGFKAGRFEIQDEGSQLVTLLAGAKPGQTAVDLCAGAGGKTLALAADMAGQGSVHAYDADRQRLAPIWDRLRRAGAEAIAPETTPILVRDQPASTRAGETIA